MTHRLMDGNLLYNINKSIKDEIDYVVMGTEGAWMVRVFSVRIRVTFWQM
jgi:hypothetical protein